VIGREDIDFINVPLDQSQISKLNATHMSLLIASLTLSYFVRDTTGSTLCRLGTRDPRHPWTLDWGTAVTHLPPPIRRPVSQAAKSNPSSAWAGVGAERSGEAALSTPSANKSN